MESKGSSEGLFYCLNGYIGEDMMVDKLHKKEILIVDWCWMCKINGGAS